MKYGKTVGACVVGLLFWSGIPGHVGAKSGDHDSVGDTPSVTAVAQGMATAHVPFLRNDGQIPDSNVRFYARTLAGSLFVTAQGELVYALPWRIGPGAGQHHADGVWSFRETIRGTESSPPEGAGLSSTRVSQYKSRDRATWKPRLAAYESVSLGEPYPGIRVTLKAAGNNVEKLFHVAPDADASVIDIVVDGVQTIAVDSEKRLVLGTTLGNIHFTAPIGYQDIGGERVPVKVSYLLRDDRHYGFSVGPYDNNHELVIDPLLASTYLGGHNPSPPGNYDDDMIHGVIAFEGDVYVAGATQSPDFPIVLGYDETLGGAYPDGFVTRMSGDLSTVIASTYIGTDSFDMVEDIALDADGTIIVVGQAGYGFPVTDGAYTWSGTTPAGGGFVARFSADLTTLIASSVATPSDYPRTAALGNGGIYFGGTTNNPDFPITPDAYLATCCAVGPFGIRDYDGFLGKLSADLSTLQAMTYLGGDVVSGIAVAGDSSVFITDGSDNAITGYIARLDDSLTTRSAYLTYYPGSQSGSSRTYFNDVVAGEGYVIAAGQTYMNDLPATTGAFDTTCGTDGVCDGVGPLVVPRSDGFVAIYTSDLQTTIALTYLGGSDHEAIRAIVQDEDGDIYVTGETTSIDFPTAGDNIDSACGSDGQCDPTGGFGTPAADGFVARMTSDLSELKYGSYLGGSGEDRPEAITVAAAGLIHVAGYTRSVDFPTTIGAFDRTYNGGTSDAFISRIDTSTGGPSNEPPLADAGPDQAATSLQVVTLNGGASIDPDGQITQYHWTQLFGRQVTLYGEHAVAARFRAPFVPAGTTRVLVFQLQVTDDRGETGVDRIRVNVTR